MKHDLTTYKKPPFASSQMLSRGIFLALILLGSSICHAQSPVGHWKVISHISEFGAQKFDSHAALLQQRPCAANMVYEVNADSTFRLNAAASGCDQKYRDIQEKLWSKTKWKMDGNKLTTSATNFAMGQTYTVTFAGNKMIWTGTEGQGVMTYQKR